jgi:hypothetical protein
VEELMRARRLWLALGVLGTIVLVAFDAPATLAIGVVCLLGFVAAGVALIATPAFLEGDEEDGAGSAQRDEEPVRRP